MIKYLEQKKYLIEKLNKVFNEIENSELLKDDYINFSTNKTCDSKLKKDIIKAYNNLNDSTSNFKKLFGSLTFKQAYVTTYFYGQTPRCPFCGQLLEIASKKDDNEDVYKYVIADIEHIIPKSLFPQLALHPNNMVPCCKECNEVIKKDKFFKSDHMNKFKEVLHDLKIDTNNMHPLKLWKVYTINYAENLNIQINKNCSETTKEFLNFYGIEHRIKAMASRCYDILFNIIRHSDIRSPESLERLLENMASNNWHEINDGYSLNNSPQIWQEFIENILYDECKLMALWDEIKSMNMSIF